MRLTDPYQCDALALAAGIVGHYRCTTTATSARMYNKLCGGSGSRGTPQVIYGHGYDNLPAGANYLCHICGIYISLTILLI